MYLFRDNVTLTLIDSFLHLNRGELHSAHFFIRPVQADANRFTQAEPFAGPFAYQGVPGFVKIVIIVFHVSNMDQAFYGIFQFHKKTEGSDTANDSDKFPTLLALHEFDFL
jgi:hypothetical protein